MEGIGRGKGDRRMGKAKWTEGGDSDSGGIVRRHAQSGDKGGREGRGQSKTREGR